MLSLSDMLFSHLRLVRPRQATVALAPAELPQGWIQSTTYCGPDRRLDDRRSGEERRTTARAGLDWWRNTDRREGRERRQAMAH